ncbi:hypothetical protein NP493_710g01125 [Ridgeia piscesae]|uniref:Leishmanolysin-like peptidase n=1 Tax=Ridgeia piscesae TaxID=27915 RepID=A0AAD9KR22_RIDPI|nr:hypothetical protein NP493_710g01125 [Ridgeia piscesae]
MQPIRIHQHYDNETMATLNVLELVFLQRILIPNLIASFEKLLKVRAIGTRLRLRRSCVNNKARYIKGDKHYYCTEGCETVTKCGVVSIPAEHLLSCYELDRDNNVTITESPGAGIDADFALYVSVKKDCQKVFTTAFHCQQEINLDRPVAGHLSICKSFLTGHGYNNLFAMVQHDMMHALGFAESLLPFFRDHKGNPYTPRHAVTKLPPIVKNVFVAGDCVIRKVKRDWKIRNGSISRSVRLLVTPTVVREVRRHFNCTTLEGAELEDQDQGIGSANSHLEKRVFGNELMTAMAVNKMVLSRITLAVLEDSGWYSVNMSRGEKLTWGADRGCEFAKKSCMEYIELRTAA